ncbi:NADPH:quinone reductase [Ktedonobacter sp. SOSP1-85]|uniref:NADP-dependent oxidoreductase n=1 Tax=Ktedonobacter sp. SOSP1-85 TaxID=2778367 RepID=UPI001914E4DA|nr:NADP-dependent oxidoreductase [Ktedonobacter sp. SOSP1-85]GHO77710.1 NADPH:quinone reductase [Ktedonobacter sp. SOSP1-85]
MKAAYITAQQGGPEVIEYGDVEQPQVGAGEILLQVHAVGISPQELEWVPTWKTADGQERAKPIIMGHEISGSVVALGEGVTAFHVGDDVYGLSSFWRNGAQAEYTIVKPAEIAMKPRRCSHIEAATLPLSALTAWQAFFEQGSLKRGQKVLIQGAAGGVGNYAVQIAHWVGAQVIAVASARQHEFLRELGADQLIDYTTMRFEDVVNDVDFVLDTIGDDTQKRSFKVLKKGGILVGIAGEQENRIFEWAKQYERDAKWFIVRPNHEQLARIAEFVDEGHMKPVVNSVYPLAETRQAYEHSLSGHMRGKVVIQVVE